MKTTGEKFRESEEQTFIHECQVQESGPLTQAFKIFQMLSRHTNYLKLLCDLWWILVAINQFRISWNSCEMQKAWIRVYAKFSLQLHIQTPSLAFAFTVKVQSCCICKRVLIKTAFPFSAVICIRWTLRP